jgi:hypothetical protein
MSLRLQALTKLLQGRLINRQDSHWTFFHLATTSNTTSTVLLKVDIADSFLNNTMASKRIITVFGATGNQGGSVIDIILARPDLAAKYAIRGISRDPASGKSKALTARGVEIIKANLDDLESIKKAVNGSHGVFGVTDFWSLNDKTREIEQGKNIFLASQAAGVKHLVFSSLPSVETLSKGKYTKVAHFDGKAIVKEFIENKKGDMVTSYFMPAMFFDKALINAYDGVPTVSLPFPDETFAWPLLAPRSDSGKWVMGLFEAGSKANGQSVQGVSTWTTPKKFVAELGEYLGKDVRFNSIPGEVFGSFLPEAIREDLTEMMLWIGESSYYGVGSEKDQASSDRFLLKDAKLTDWPTFIKENSPWNF